MQAPGAGRSGWDSARCRGRSRWTWCWCNTLYGRPARFASSTSRRPAPLDVALVVVASTVEAIETDSMIDTTRLSPTRAAIP
jgi:hypothetical protein